MGRQKHIISDQDSVFTGDALAELVRQWNIKPRFGAVGKHGSIAVTERVIKTLKYEWLRNVPIIKSFDHLTALCTEFESWYNAWRPHMTSSTLPSAGRRFLLQRQTRDAKPKSKDGARQYRTPCTCGNAAHGLSSESRGVASAARLPPSGWARVLSGHARTADRRLLAFDRSNA
jgi:Integrase core domain